MPQTLRIIKKEKKPSQQTGIMRLVLTYVSSIAYLNSC